MCTKMMYVIARIGMICLGTNKRKIIKKLVENIYKTSHESHVAWVEGPKGLYTPLPKCS